MPKENINDEVSPGFRAEVSWRPGREDDTGWVQVATTYADGPHVVTTVVNDLTGEPSGSACTCGTTVSVPDISVCPEADHPQGWRVTLNREGINRMIRMLRRARDAAFGADA